VEPFDVDHIIPQASAGGDELENLALCCSSCNTWKADHIFSIDPETHRKTPLFNPRQDAWSEHFRVIRFNGKRGRDSVSDNTSMD
jgi:5-methylcytosine-specific restriction endonuclease McrA